MKRIAACIGLLLALVNTCSYAQTLNTNVLTLKQAVDAAINNNLQVKQSDLQMQASQVQLKQAKTNVLPDVFANLGHGLNQGRSIDPFTNAYINRQVAYANYNVSSGVTLFNGFQIQNLIRQNAFTYEASKMDLRQLKENVTLNVILAYLQILNNQEQLTQAQNQADLTRKQVERLNTLDKAGAITPNLFYDLKGQLANDELQFINSKNSLDAAKLTLSQLMNVPYNRDMQVERLSIDQPDIDYPRDPSAIYEMSLKQLAVIKAADYRQKSAEKGVQVAKSLYYPSLGLSGSFNTNYSNAASQNIALNTVEVASGDYITVGGNKVPVMTQRTNFATERISYGNQFTNNYNTSLFLSLRVPIFNRFRAKNQVALARLDLQNAEVSAEAVKVQLNQNIEQAYFQMTAANDRLKALQQQVADFQESFRTAEVRFNAGVLTQVEYLIAKNNVERARINLISAKYDYIFRTKILDYYQGKLTL